PVAGSPLPQTPVAGPIQTVVVYPGSNSDLWVGTTNGGIWRTRNANVVPPELGEVAWTPLLDLGPSMSISVLEIDPTALGGDADHATLVAGVGRTSNFVGQGSQRTGVIRSTNGGATWAPLGNGELSGLDVTGLAPRGSVIVVAAKDPAGTGRGGI